MPSPASVFLSWLRGVHDVAPYWPEIDERVATGDFQWLEEVVRGMESPAFGLEPWVVQSIRGRAEDGLALTPGVASARGAIAIAQLSREVSGLTDSPSAAASVAARLGAAQSDATFAEVAREHVGNPMLEDWLATWMYERVARGADLSAVAEAVELAASLRAHGHPLGRLLLALRPIESETPGRLPRYARGASSVHRPGLPPAPTSPPLEQGPPDEAAAEVQDAAGAGEALAIAAAVGPGSNWKVDARVLRAARVPLHIGPAFLASLGMPCFDGAPLEAITARVASASDAFGALFSVAAVGGAYGGGRGGAWGRLAAWQSLAALVGRPGELEPEAIERAVHECRFCLFDADAAWWYHVAWDLGVAVRRPDGRTLALLAATDTD